MSSYQVALLALIQGLAELLPVSSSAHVIFTMKILGIDPSTPEASFLLVMLHCGTMLAVLLYFWKRWRLRLQSHLVTYLRQIVLATAVTGGLGLLLKFLIERIVLEKYFGFAKGEIEQLFNMLPLISACLLVSGLMILISGLMSSRKELRGPKKKVRVLEFSDALWIGLVQGLVLPMRGLSRSGMTISAGLLRGLGQLEVEEFSFALAVALTPAVLWHELTRWMRSVQEASSISGKAPDWAAHLLPGVLGLLLSFGAGMLALKWLSRWLENGKWYFFGIYCLFFSLVLLISSEVFL